MPPKQITETRRIGNEYRENVLVIGIVLTVAAIWLGHYCWFLGLEAFVKLAAAALLMAGTV